MASEYTLQLKAMLDTSDVQQKLNQLKQQQTSSGSGNGGLGNGGIQQVLQRLNTTLANLQRSIDKLSGQQGKQASTVGAKGAPVVIGGRPLASATSRPSSTARVSPMALGAGLRSMQREFVQGFDLSDRYNPARQMQPVMSEWRRFQRHGLTGRQLWNRLDSLNGFSAVEDWQAQQGSASAFQRRLNAYRQQQIANNPILAREREMQASGSTRMSRQMRANLRMGAGLAFGSIAGGVENYAQATGNQGLATGAGFVKNIGYGAAAGALMGGPIGAVIGGSVGALNSAFEELARRAREAASALDEQHKRIFSGQSVDRSVREVFRDRADREAEKKGDRRYFEEELKKSEDLYKKALDALNKEVGAPGSEGLDRFKLREYEKETERLMKLRGQDDPEVKRRQNVATLYTANADVLKRAEARTADIERIMDKLGPALRTPINKGRADAAAEQAKSLKEALKNLKAPDMTNVNSLASQGFMISAADDEARLDEANKHLTDLVNLTRQIKDKENEAATYG